MNRFSLEILPYSLIYNDGKNGYMTYFIQSRRVLQANVCKVYDVMLHVAYHYLYNLSLISLQLTI